jgi:dethiobiotin synthetase
MVSAIIAEALGADYWKPVQAGDLDNTDTLRVKGLVSNPSTRFHKSAYLLTSPMSPHAAAAIDGIAIKAATIVEPPTGNDLVIEGAGGLLVPLNDRETVMDLIQPHYKVVVVSRHYLGSINHSLLTLECLKAGGFYPSIIFSGAANPTTEDIILKKTGARLVGRVDEEPVFNKGVIARYAHQFAESLRSL